MSDAAACLQQVCVSFRPSPASTYNEHAFCHYPATNALTGLASDVSVSAMRDATLSLQQAAALLAAAELEDEPGAVFKYSNTAMQVAGAAVEAVSGHTWHEVRAGTAG